MDSSEQINKMRPSLEEVREIWGQVGKSTPRATMLPVCMSLPADLLTPAAIYLRLSEGSTAPFSFLLESATGSTETVGRYSFIGSCPYKVIQTGDGYSSGPVDPLAILQSELDRDRVVSIPSLNLPPFTGGAVGYIGYDCVRYFEPKTDRPLKDNLGIPEALFMLYDTIVAFDHFFCTVSFITHLRLPEGAAADVGPAYEKAEATLRAILTSVGYASTPIPRPPQPRLDTPEGGPSFSSNVGRRGYESFVTQLKHHVREGNIIQAVPSQRLARRTGLHPFNLYRTLRTVNPSPYLVFMTCSGFSIVGASPECLVKTAGYECSGPDPSLDPGHAGPAGPSRQPKIINHAIAGTIARGRSAAEDNALGEKLLSSEKDRAEHVMLVDLARNDVNRVCDPATVKVDRLMKIDRFSHVQHLTSEVSGVLRPGRTRWDALRSVFPAGTVSGAPKIRAMELIYELEAEKRGVYAGAAGWFGYDLIRAGAGRANVVDQGAMDTCIAIRTMLVKDGVAYMQAGGGIVFDSDEADEWMETMNKLAANMVCIEMSEHWFGNGPAPRTAAAMIDEERMKGSQAE